MHHTLPPMTVTPAAVDKPRELFIAPIAESIHDAGCVAYSLYQQANTPDVCQTVEQWRDPTIDLSSKLKSRFLFPLVSESSLFS